MSVEVKQKYIFFGPEIIRVKTHRGSKYLITVKKRNQLISILSKDGKKTEIYFGTESEFVKSFQDMNKRHDLKNDYNAKTILGATTIHNYTPDELKILAQFELMFACLHPVRCYCLDAIIEPLLSVMHSSDQDIRDAYIVFVAAYLEWHVKYDVPLEVENFLRHQSPGICDW